MKHTIFRSISIFVFCALSLAAASAQQTVNNPDIVMKLQWEIGPWRAMWNIKQFPSQSVGEDVGYYIYLPPGYEQDLERTYPVVIWLHGAYGRPHDATPIIGRLDKAVRRGEAPPMIVVSVLDPTGLSMWTDSKDGRLPMETLIIDDLIPHIDKTYRTKATRDGRAIEGFSMGGYGAAYLGFKYLDHFSSVSMLAAALHTPETLKSRRRAIYENVFGGDAGYASQRSPWVWAQKNAEQIKQRTRVRVFVGADDGLLAWNQDFHELLNTHDIQHQWGVVPNSPHDVGIIMQNWEGDFFSYYRTLFSED